MQRAGEQTALRSDAPLIVETAIQHLKNIATLPAVALKILRLADDPDSTIDDLNQVIKCDPALCTRILKVVNSSFYGLPRQIGSIDRAVLLLGLNAVKNIAIAVSLDRVFRTEQIAAGFDVRDLWTHSIAVATGARGLAEKAEMAVPDEAFLAGLVHDIGMIAETQACRPKFVELIDRFSDDHGLTFREAEEQILGATHESFGAALCRSWQLPVNLEYVAGFHHRPMQLPEAVRALPAVVHLADILAARLDIGFTQTVETDDFDPQVLDSLNLGEDEIAAVATTLPEAFRETQQLLADGGAD